MLAYERSHAGEKIIVVNNLSDRPLELRLPAPVATSDQRDLLGHTLRLDPAADGPLMLCEPYGYYWLKV